MLKSQDMSLPHQFKNETKTPLSRFSWKSIKGAEELQKRLVFTLLVLVIYRFGTFIQVPGLNPQVLAEYVSKSGGGFLAMFDTFSGGSIGRATIMALSLAPYITSSILMQLISAAVPSLKALGREGETGQQKKNQYVRYITLGLAITQALGIAAFLETVTSPLGAPAVLVPGFLFKFTTLISIVGGTFFLMWLAEQITARGLGQGSSMIIYAGIVANLPSTISHIKRMHNTGQVSSGLIWFDACMLLVLLLIVVFIERSYRRVQVQYPKGQMHMINGMKIPDEMPVKLNVVGVMAPIFASTMISFIMIIARMLPKADVIVAYISKNGVYFSIFSVLIVFFVFAFSPVLLNPEETAESLRKNNGFIPGYRPGAQTAVFFQHLLTRLAFIGAAYLLIVCVLPDMFIKKDGLNVYFGGTSLLIIVGVAYELVSQISGFLLSLQYEDMFKRMKHSARLRGFRN